MQSFLLLKILCALLNGVPSEKLTASDFSTASRPWACRETCRRAQVVSPFGRETCRRAHVESLGVEWHFIIIHEENFMSNMEMSFLLCPWSRPF